MNCCKKRVKRVNAGASQKPHKNKLRDVLPITPEPRLMPLMMKFSLVETVKSAESRNAR